MALGLSIEPFDPTQAEITGRRWGQTRKQGSFPGDRACLALAMYRSLPALTADQAWKRLKLNLEIRLLC
jgi:PIN domain nuclease of toxin-antitoxin system